MTAALADTATDVFWRPSAALQVAHNHPRSRRVAQAIVATICAFTLILSAAPATSALDVSVSETGVAAQTSVDHTTIGAEAPGAPTGLGETGTAIYDSTSGCCVAPNTTHPVTGVPIVDGFPVFDYAFDVRLPGSKNGPDITDGVQMRHATRQLRDAIDANPGLADRFSSDQLAAIQRGRDRIPDLTWHHHQDGVRLQLVDRQIHLQTGHSGGRAATGGR